jgi:hypothetical protein
MMCSERQDAWTRRRDASSITARQGSHLKLGYAWSAISGSGGELL